MRYHTGFSRQCWHPKFYQDLKTNSVAEIEHAATLLRKEFFFAHYAKSGAAAFDTSTTLENKKNYFRDKVLYISYDITSANELIRMFSL